MLLRNFTRFFEDRSALGIRTPFLLVRSFGVRNFFEFFPRSPRFSFKQFFLGSAIFLSLQDAYCVLSSSHHLPPLLAGIEVVLRSTSELQMIYLVYLGKNIISEDISTNCGSALASKNDFVLRSPPPLHTCVHTLNDNKNPFKILANVRVLAKAIRRNCVIFLHESKHESGNKRQEISRQKISTKFQENRFEELITSSSIRGRLKHSKR